MDDYNLRDLILTCSVNYLQSIVNNRNWTIFFKCDNEIYKCRIVEIDFTITGIKLKVKQIASSIIYTVSLDDYKFTWSDHFSDIKFDKIKQYSLFDLAEMSERE